MPQTVGMGLFTGWDFVNFGGAALDLVLPRECGGCGRAGVQWCTRCAVVLEDHPIRLSPRVDPGVPVWALGAYSGPRRRSVIAMKERGRRDLATPLGVAVAEAMTALRRWGELDFAVTRPAILITAPSRSRAARSRAGDPVLRVAQAVRAALPEGCVEVHDALAMARGVRDSVGLSAADRALNVSGRIVVTKAAEVLVNRDADVVFLDDVLTTGATAAESIRALRIQAIRTSLALVLAGA